MTDLFAWTPSYTPQMTRKPRVLAAQFGDGYAQRVADGINAVDVSWSLTFSARDQNEAAAFVTFLDAHGGHVPFRWVDPNGLLATWICADYGTARTSPRLYGMTATFTRDFAPIPMPPAAVALNDLIITR